MAAFSTSVYSYSLNAYNGMTGKGIISLAPMMSFPVSPEFASSIDLIGSYGFTPNFDMFVNIADFNLAPTAEYAYSWIMPRFEFLPNNILALQLQLNNSEPLSYSITPQYHLFYENDNFAFEFNASALFPINDSQTSTSISGIIAPVWKAIKGILYPFVEFDPSYVFGDTGGFHLNVIPGVWLGIPDTPHQFCLALTLSDITSGALGYSVNFWYSVSFSMITDSEMK